MSILGYTGLPGSGKSYEVVNGPILRAVENGRTVWTNIPVNIEGVRVVDGEEACGHWYLTAPPGALVVIDECWRYWPSGLKADMMPDDQKEWFAMHRHRTHDGAETDIVLVTQDLAQIASFVRNLVSKTWRMRKLDAIGTKSLYRIDVYEGAVTGQRPPKDRHISGWRRRYNPEGFKRYKSHTQGGAAEMKTVDGRGAMWKNPAILAIPFGIAAVFLIPRAFSVITPGMEEADEPAAVERSEPAPAVPPAPRPRVAAPAPAPSPTPAPTPSGPTESKRWVLQGVIAKADGTGVAMLESATGRRRVTVEDHCENTGTEWRCIVDDQVVTMWTGSGVLRAVQGETYNKRGQ